MTEVAREDLALLVRVALGTCARRRKRGQEWMTVGDEKVPIALVESVADKYDRVRRPAREVASR